MVKMYLRLMVFFLFVFNVAESQVTSYPITFSNTAGGLTESNGVWTASASGAWGHVGLSSQKFEGNARIMMKYDAAAAINGVIGVDASNTLPESPFYNDINAGVVISANGVVKKVENSAGVTVGTVAIGDWVCLYRSGSVFKIQKSTDNRATWTDLNTLLFTSSASLYITASVFNDGKIYSPALELYNPSTSIIFSSTAGGLTESNGVWTASASGAWGHVGLSSLKFEGNARIMMKYDSAAAINGVIGVDASNTLPESPYYNDINAGVVISANGVVKKVENSAGVTVGTVAIGDWVCLYRSGSVFKVQKSTDNRATWTDLNTLLFTSSASLYITSSVYNDGKIYSPTLQYAVIENDAACSAISLTAGGSQRCANTTLATSVNDPVSACTAPNNSVWYQYTATTDGTVLLNMKTPAAPANPLHGWSNWYTRTGTCPAVSFSAMGNCQQFGDGGNNDIDNLLSPVLTAGTTYYILVNGFAGDVGEFCISIPACSPPLSVLVDHITSNSASVNWTGTGTFILEYGPSGFTPGTGAAAGAGGTVINPATSAQTITGLIAVTGYDVYVRQNCAVSNQGFSNNSTAATFTTPGQAPVNDDCSGAIALTVFDSGCGGATAGTTFNATTSTNTPLPECGMGAAGYDDDVWFKFTPVAGQLFASVDFVSTGGDNNFVAQIYTSSNNTCSGTFTLFACSEDSGPDNLYRFTSMPVTAGTTYFIRVFSYNRGVNSQFTVCVTNAHMINDNASGAVLINVDAGCTGAIYTNVGATQSVGEPTGSCSSTTGYATAWYKFKAPAGGAVRISTAAGSGNTLTNTRVALFDAGDVNNYNTFTIIGCDEDGGAGSFGSMSVLYATGLTAGFTYYIQVDKFDNTVAEGTYCITIDKLKDNMLAAANNCNNIYQAPVGSIASYKGWVPLMDENSKLIALVRDTLGGRVDAYTVSQNINAGAVRKDNTSGEHYLNRSYTINNTAATNTAVNLQFFFLASEQASLAAVDHAADALANLRVTRQSAITCQPDFVTANGINSELQQTGSGISNGVGWVTVNTTGFSNFYIHSVKSYLTAKVFLQGAYNASIGRHKDVTAAWAGVLNTYAKNQPYNPVKYEGFGANTPGGKGQQVVHVINLDATGPGSLHDAIGSNRTIVFDVAGTIYNFNWDSSIEPTVSFLTIDGSTAPAPGITLDNGNSPVRVNGLSFQYGCHDIIVKNIRVRNAINDGINVVGGYNMVFDHVSVADCGDGNLDITDGAHDITVQYSVFGHSGNGAMLIAYPGTRDISLHHNLFNSTGAGVGERNPLVHNAINFVPNIISYLMADYTNNIVWNWGNTNGGGYGSGADYGGTLQVRNNFYQSVTLPGNAIVVNKESIGAKVFASGNVSGNAGINPNSVSNMAAPWSVAAVTTQDACTAAAIVLAQAGCQPRDAIDQALINTVSLAGCPATVAEGNYTGSESVANGFFTSTPADTDIVDWVLLEIKNSAGITKSRNAAFVREDGKIVDLDGTSAISLYGLGSGIFNITVKHRNHLGISTQNGFLFVTSSLGVTPSNPQNLDFTTATDAAIFGDALAYRVINGINVMIGGNANSNNNVRFQNVNNDVASILLYLNNITSGSMSNVYNPNDVNMDGTVRYQNVNNDPGWLLNNALNNITSGNIIEQKR